MRPILCNLHNRMFRGHGITQVFHKIVFNFCEHCWIMRRHDCNEHMKHVVFGPSKPAAKEEAARRRRTLFPLPHLFPGPHSTSPASWPALR
jgi:hypothetical protein